MGGGSWLSVWSLPGADRSAPPARTSLPNKRVPSAVFLLGGKRGHQWVLVSDGLGALTCPVGSEFMPQTWAKQKGAERSDVHTDTALPLTLLPRRVSVSRDA